MNSFITDEVIAKIVDSINGDGSVTGIEWRIENLINNGGYCSDIYRVHVTYLQNDEWCSNWLFVKNPYDCAMYSQTKDTGMYEKEIYTYSTILPAFHEMLQEECLAPTFYFSDDKHAMILKDISKSDYRTCDRRLQLDFEHSVCALKLLAKFHAASVKMQKISPQILSEMMYKSPWDDCFDSDGMKSFFCERFTSAFHEVEPEFVKEHAEELTYYKGRFMGLVKQEMEAKEGSFNVLNHGDIWTNNILFKYNKYEDVEDVKFVDFQQCRWGSPALDLVYFVLTCVRFEIFEKYFDLLLEIYATALSRTLKYLQCDCVYSIDDLRRDIENKSNYGVFLLIYPVPLALSERTLKVQDMNGTKILKSKFFKKHAKAWFSYYIRKGVFSPPTDTDLVISTFIRKFQAEYNVTVTHNKLEDNVVKVGTNYFSGIRRLTIEYRNNDGSEKLVKSVILKIPSLCTSYERVKASHIFENEIHMYQKFFPEMYKFWNGEPLVPTFHLATKTDALVLEDLQEAGFRMRDKKQQLDFDHSRAALELLARFHALSVKHYQKHGDSLDPAIATEFRFTSSCEAFSYGLYDKFLETVKSVVSKNDFQTLEGYKNDYFVTVYMTMMPDPDGFLVMCHGDYWTNNIMYQYDDQNRIIGSRLVDFQLCRRASPVIDLIHFFVASVQFNVFEQRYDDLIHCYLDTLNDTLNSLDCNCKYNRSKLNKDLRKYKFMFIYTLSTMLPVILSGAEESTILDGKATAEVFKSQRYLTLLLSWIPHLIKKKLF